MTEKRLKELLYNALAKFAKDEYEKEQVLDDLGMTEQEFDEITKDEFINFISY